jgi:uncharacterized OB-fold protein
MTKTAREPVAGDLFTDRSLVGGRCESCGETFFPWRDVCPKDHAPGAVRVDLPRTGTVWSFSTQEFLPVAPYAGRETRETFVPFVFGYVDLPGACKVETRLDVPAERSRELVGIGTEVEFVTIPFDHADGRELTTYAFRPIRKDPS